MNIYVGNLSYQADEKSLRDLFSAHGEVTSVRLMTDRESGRPRGFGFVEMSSDQEAQKAIADLNGKDLAGRPLTVNEARPKVEQNSQRRSFSRNRY